MLTKLSKCIVKNPNLICILAVALMVPSLIGYLVTPVNYDILSFLPAQEELGDIEDTNAVYGIGVVGDTANLSIVIMEDLSPKEMDRICDNVNKVDGVASAMWVGSVADIGIPESMYPDMLKEMLYAENAQGGESTLMLVQYDPDDPDNPKFDSIAKVNAVKEVLNEKCYVFGLSSVMSDTKALVESEMFLYIAIAVGLASLIAFVTTKQWLVPPVIMATLGCGVALNMGTNILIFHDGISYLTQAIGAILQMAVTIDYAIILLDRFEEECQKTTNVKKAMARTIKRCFSSLLGGASTTFFGFIALCFMSLTVGLEIGIVMAKGVVFGLLSVLIVMPAILLKFYNVIFKYEHKRFIPNFDKPVDFVIKHKKGLVAVFLASFAFVYVLGDIVPTYTDLNGKMPEDSHSLIASKKLNDDFGIKSMNVALVSDDIPAGQVSDLIKDMEKVPGVKSVIGLNSFLGGAIPAEILPDAITNIIKKEVKTDDGLKGYNLIIVFGNKGLEDEEEFRAMKKELNSVIKAVDEEGCLTGEAIMYDELVDIAEVDLVVTSLISILTVAVLIGLTFKSLFLPVILVSGVQFAIYLNLATSTVMEWFWRLINPALGTDFNSEVVFLAPIVLGCVQLGATIDYAILLTSRYQEELRKGREKHSAMSIAAKAASKSIFQSAITFFSATIGIVVVGKIEIVQDLCVLMARGALISAVVVILFITPMLLCWDKLVDKTTFGWKVEKEFNFKRGFASMKKNIKAIKSVVSVILCVCLTLGFAGCSGDKDDTQNLPQTEFTYENAAKDVTKSETVFVNLKADGTWLETTVTDWIHTEEGNVRVYDVSDLDKTTITNVKGDMDPIFNTSTLDKESSEIMWNMNTDDLYYTGKTSKKTPIEIGINYYLNGKSVSAEEVAGASGTVKIEFNFTNHYTKAVKVNGQTRKMYLPMVVVGGTIFSESKVSQIVTENGLSIGDGSNEVVGVFSIPGIGPSLGIGTEDIEGYGDIKLNDKASITVQTDCFELGNMYFAAVPVASLDLDFDASNQVDSLQGTLNILQTLLGSLENIDIEGLLNTISANSNSISGLASVLNEAIYVYESNQSALEKLTRVMTSENMAAIQNLLIELEKPETKNTLDTLTNSSLIQTLMNLESLAAALEDAQPVMNELSAVMSDPQMQQTLNNLDSTMAVLDDLQRQIDANKNVINMLTDLMSSSNLQSITDISSVLANSDVQLSDYGIIVDDTDAFVANCEAWVKVGQDYGIFTDAYKNMKTNVIFVYKTESIGSNYNEDDIPAPETEEEDTPWYKKLFD